MLPEITKCSANYELDMRKIVDLFRSLASVPSVKCGSILKNDDAIGRNSFTISCVWSQRDLSRGDTSVSSKNYVVFEKGVVKLPATELNNEQWNVLSPSGKLTAIVRKLHDTKTNNSQQYLEIWSSKSKFINLDVQSLEKHGAIYDDDLVFGSFVWSPTGTKLLYIAEAKQQKTRSYFKQGSKVESEIEGDMYAHKESWGEQMGEKCKPVICVLDVTSSLISVVDWLPQNMSYGQAIWGLDDSTIYVIGWYHEPYRLGIVYCPIRRNTLMAVDLEKKTFKQIGPNGRSLHHPVLSRQGDKLVYLDNPCSGPHMQCSRLVLQDTATDDWSILVDQVNAPKPDTFPGLYCSDLQKKFWSRDNKRIIMASHWRSKIELLVINIEDKTIKRLTNDANVGAWKLLHIDSEDRILCCCSSINKSDYVVYGKLPQAGQEDGICWNVVDSPEFDGSDKINWSTVSVEAPGVANNKYECLDYEYIFVEPRQPEDKMPPLLVFNHGGPHSVFGAGFSHLIAGHCLSGMSLLLVNYRGSLGFGQNGINSLLGNIGTQDVLDIKYVLDRLVEKKKVDPSKLSVAGGSHGGFLTCHLIGQYPDLFKAAVVRNPVFNLMTLLGTSDIPDWVYTEMSEPFDAKLPLSGELCAELYNKSPIAHVHKVKTPTLFLLGAKDRRVPVRQGLQCWEILKSCNVATKALVYPDSNHPLSELEAEGDAFVNSIKWLNSFLNFVD